MRMYRSNLKQLFIINFFISILSLAACSKNIPITSDPQTNNSGGGSGGNSGGAGGTSRSSSPVLSPEEMNIANNYSSAVGLRNLINTCFANSVTKLLWADSRYSKQVVTRANPSLVPTQVQTLFFDLMSLLDSNWALVSADPKNTALSTNNYSNELNAFYDELERFNLTRVPSANKLPTEEIDPSTPSKIRKDQVDAHSYLMNLNQALGLSNLDTPFYYSSQITFTDGFKNNIQHPANGNHEFGTLLSIQSPAVTSIIMAINLYAQLEQVSGVNRDDTGQPDNGVKENFFTIDRTHTPPSRVILTLNRTDYQTPGNKLNKVIDPSASITLGFFEHNSITPGNSLSFVSNKTYNLKGVVVQRGNASGGHYYTYLIDSQNNWFIHDDLQVRQLKDDEIVNMWHDIGVNGYIFLYQE